MDLPVDETTWRRRVVSEQENDRALSYSTQVPVYSVYGRTGEMDSKKKVSKTRWKKELYDFSQDTTIHALKQITEPTPFLIRRIIWFLLLVAGLVLFIIQLVQSAMYYNSNPVAVNIVINYNDTLRFPAVTVCNQNAFKMSEASSMGYYDVLTELYSQNPVTNSSALSKSQILDIPYNELLLALSHKKEDFIVGCEWAKEPCLEDDIELSITDSGLCFTFNDGHVVKEVSQTGGQWGLRLHLNLEQYEYMTGPTSGAGVKVLVHEQGTVAEVSEQGQAIPPGLHGYFGLTIIQVHDLKPPYGKCSDDVKLKHYHRYSQTSCYTECMQEEIEKRCKCTYDYDNPYHEDHGDLTITTVKLNGSDDGERRFPVCTLGQYLECALPTMHGIKDLHTICTCPHSCDKTHFETTVTYGAPSIFDMLENVHEGNHSELARKFHDAREIRQRVDPYMRANDHNLAKKLHLIMSDLEQALDEIPQKLDDMASKFLSEANKLEDRIQFHHNKGIKNVKYIIEHDFIRGWDILEERTFSHVATGFWEIVASVDRVVLLLTSDWKSKSLDYRQIGWYSIDDQLLTRYIRADRARVNLTEVDNAYKTGKHLLNFETTIDRRYDLLYITPELFRTETRSQNLYYGSANSSLTKYMAAIVTLREYGALLVNQTDASNLTVSEARNDFIANAKQINYRLFQFKSKVLMKPVEIIDATISDFLVQNTTFWNEYEKFHAAVKSASDEIAKIKNESWGEIKLLSEIFFQYTLSGDNRSSTKTYLATEFNTNTMAGHILEVRHFFTLLRSRALEIQDSTMRLRKLYAETFETMVTEETTKRFYAKIAEDFNEYKYNNGTTDFVRIFAYMIDTKRSAVRNMSLDELECKLNADFAGMDLQDALSKMELYFTLNLNPEIEVLQLLNNNDEAFFTQIENVQADMEKYITENELNFNFFRQNYLNVDVFMKELSYEFIDHQKAYDIVNLMSDIGGSIGLFVGASALSVFEILDVLIHTAAKIITENDRKKKPSTNLPIDGAKYQESGLMT